MPNITFNHRLYISSIKRYKTKTNSMYKCFINRDNEFKMHLSLIDFWKLCMYKILICRNTVEYISTYIVHDSILVQKNLILPHFVFYLYRTWIMYNYAALLSQVLRENRANWQRKDYNFNFETVIFDITCKIGNCVFVDIRSFTSCRSIYSNTSSKILSFLYVQT